MFMWKLTNNDSVLIGTFNQEKKLLESKYRIAGFDLDGTIIKPLGKKKRFTKKDKFSDWEFAVDEKKMRKTFQLLKQNEYTIIIVSNQKGGKKSLDLDVWKKKVDSVVEKLGIDCTVYCAIKDDNFRKPATGIFDKYVNYSKKHSFFCGDAGGRKGDFADTDRKFAINLTITFYTPDEYFLDETPKDYLLKYPDFPERATNEYDKLASKIKKRASTKSMILMIGFPGCGKSRFTEKYLSKYKIINQDTLKTLPKCLKAANEFIKNDETSIVIDNTNLDVKTRDTWIKLAEKNDMKVIAVWFNVDVALCKHNSTFRSHVNSKPKIKDLVYRVMNKRFVKPELEEGFDWVIRTEFYFDDTDSDTAELYYRYYY